MYERSAYRQHKKMKIQEILMPIGAYRQCTKEVPIGSIKI